MKARGFPLAGAAMSATINRLKTIADQAGDALLTEGPVQPDHKLLDLCAEALHNRRLYDAANAVRDTNNQQRDADNGRGWTDAGAAAHWTEFREEQTFQAAMRRVLSQAKKLKATTAAGIYAKALIVRSSRSGAMLLAMSLAEDLIACPGLRESLWPADREEA